MRRTLFDTEHDAFRESVRAFLLKEAVPRTAEWEAAGLVDRSFWSAAAAQGLVAFSAPEEFGGAGLRDFRFNAVLNEEIVRVGAVGDGFSLTNDIVLPYYRDIATPEQQARWIPGITAGRTVIAIAMSEPGTGSDLRAIATTATRESGGWRLNGSKTFITSGIQADLVIVAARIPESEGGDSGCSSSPTDRTDSSRAASSRRSAGAHRTPPNCSSPTSSCPTTTCWATRAAGCTT